MYLVSLKPLYIYWSLWFGSFAVEPSVTNFKTLSFENQYDFIEKYKTDKMSLDSVHFLNYYNPLLNICERQKNYRCESFINGIMGHYFGFNRKNETMGISYFKKSISLSVEHDLAVEQGIFTAELADVYRSKGRIELAYEYYLKSYQIISKIPLKIPDASRRFLNFGQFFYGIEDYPQALNVLLKAEKAPFFDIWSHRQILNHIAESYQRLGDIPHSLAYHQKLLTEAKKDNDTLWIGITSGNIGVIYLKKSQLDLAKPLCELDLEISLKYKDLRNAGFALQNLAQINIKKNNWHQALLQLKEAEKLLTSTCNNFDKVYIFTDLAKVQEQLGNLSEALKYNKQAFALKDSLNKVNDIKKLNRVEQKLANERAKQTELQAENEKKVDSLIRFSLLGLLMAVVVIVLQFYSREKLKFKKNIDFITQKNALLESEKQRVDDALSHAQNQLDVFVNNVKKNVSLNEILYDNAPTFYKETLSKIIILTQEDWQKFKISFDKIYHDFFEKLLCKYSDLSQAEIRLLALIKLNFSSDEMAYSLGVGVNTIKKTRQRIRQKIEISEKESLADWLKRNS